MGKHSRKHFKQIKSLDVRAAGPETLKYSNKEGLQKCQAIQDFVYLTKGFNAGEKNNQTYVHKQIPMIKATEMIADGK